MKVLVVGATGGTGRELVKQALERGYDVTAFVRRAGKLGIAHPKLRIVEGDVLRYETVEQASKGQDAVVSALGHKRWFWKTSILSGGTRNIISAMQKHGVRRFVCETSLGVGDSRGRLGVYYTLFLIPLLLHFYFWDKGKQEKIIRESDLDWVIVRPGVLTNGRKRGVFRHGPRIGNWIISLRISRADVAEFMLNQISSDEYLRKAVGVVY